MACSRRAFVRNLSAGTAGTIAAAAISARGRENMVGLWARGIEAELEAAESEIILSSNENPLGAGNTVLAAARKALGPESGRYANAYRPLEDAIATKFGVQRENVLIGCGSSQILRTATEVFTSPVRPLVGSLPTYEECAGYAELVNRLVKGVPLDSELRFDIEPSVEAARGAGLVFYCNPNNPTATVHTPATTNDFLTRLHQVSPETNVLIDEAYIDYVTMPGHTSEIQRAVQDPRIVVARTFSKAYGMAGLRVGYAIAHKDTIRRMASWESGNTLSQLSLIAAIAAIQQDDSFTANERARNAGVRDFTRDFFHKLGYKDSESQANFLFVDVRMPIQEFSAACRKQGVKVARPFPPLLTQARISIGTMDEMKRATVVFGNVLKSRAKAA